ncbi:MAG: deoxyribonuclease IV, partial [Solirubrobacteraceae bacterium]|nr:deoxyribonuclease IV [Solirubrobacteraceae bacterium]
MLIGCHVSPAGGPHKAIERGVERGCTAIQIFNQSPRAWKPNSYDDAALAKFHQAQADSDIGAVLIHAIYLLNPGSEDPEIRQKSLASLSTSLQVGDAIGSAGVVLHPGSALKGPVPPAIERAGAVIAECLAASESCPLHLEITAGAGGTLGRTFAELAELIDAAGGSPRLGVCLDSCHLLASGYDVRSPEAVTAVVDEFEKELGLDRLGSLHLNDSQYPLGSNRDRHANLGEGEIGEIGIKAFLQEPRFQHLPCVLETPGPDGKGTAAEEIVYARELH